jgi:hypothetical protein
MRTRARTRSTVRRRRSCCITGARNWGPGMAVPVVPPAATECRANHLSAGQSVRRFLIELSTPVPRYSRICSISMSVAFHWTSWQPTCSRIDDPIKSASATRATGNSVTIARVHRGHVTGKRIPGSFHSSTMLMPATYHMTTPSKSNVGDSRQRIRGYLLQRWIVSDHIGFQSTWREPTLRGVRGIRCRHRVCRERRHLFCPWLGHQASP